MTSRILGNGLRVFFTFAVSVIQGECGTATDHDNSERIGDRPAIHELTLELWR